VSEEGCTFATITDRCRKITDAGQELCPRHLAIVTELGMEEAQGRENGYECPCCSDRQDEPFTECKECDAKSCAACQKSGECCIEDEIEDLEGDIAELQARLASNRRKRDREAANA
jgi:uncharacterized protein YceH (UPF0502 family)